MPDDNSRKPIISTRLEALSAASLGLLTGLLIGLSVADVVSSVIAGLVAMLGAFFGLQPSKEDAPEKARGRTIRIGAFAGCCAAALIIGVVLRTHAWLSPDITTQVSQLEAAGYSKADALSLVTYQRFGIQPGGATTVEPQNTVRAFSSALFSDTQERCDQLRQDRYADAQEWVAAMRRAGGPWTEFAAAVQDLPTANQAQLLQTGWGLACN